LTDGKGGARHDRVSFAKGDIAVAHRGLCIPILWRIFWGKAPMSYPAACHIFKDGQKPGQKCCDCKSSDEET
jgi:hypothetical protein